MHSYAPASFQKGICFYFHASILFSVLKESFFFCLRSPLVFALGVQFLLAWRLRRSIVCWLCYWIVLQLAVWEKPVWAKLPVYLPVVGYCGECVSIAAFGKIAGKRLVCVCLGYGFALWCIWWRGKFGSRSFAAGIGCFAGGHYSVGVGGVERYLWFFNHK